MSESTRFLTVSLTDEEVAEVSQDLAATIHDREETQRSFEAATEAWKRQKKSFEGALGSLDERLSELADQVTARKAERDVPVDWHYSLAQGKAYLVRRDTMEALEYRELRPEERQLKIGDVLKPVEADDVMVEQWEEQLEARKGSKVEPEPEAEDDDGPPYYSTQSFPDGTRAVLRFSGRERTPEQLTGVRQYLEDDSLPEVRGAVAFAVLTFDTYAPDLDRWRELLREEVVLPESAPAAP